MKKFMNDPADMAAESLAGFVAAHHTLVMFGEDGRFVQRTRLTPGKVALVSGGGAGHEPLHSGFVGAGMLDAACSGHIFTSPTPDQIVAAIRAVDQGAGTLLIVKNYDGDIMNFEMAAELASQDPGRSVRMVVVADDVSVAQAIGRRGIAGAMVVEKIVGAAAEAGLSLDGCADLAARVSAVTRSMGVALRGATLPTATRETFVLGEGDMEIGVGIHGEPGGARAPIRDARAIVTEICSRIRDDVGANSNGRLLLFVNGLGATPLAETYLAYGIAHDFWTSHGFDVARSLVGPYVTSLDMQGLSITVALLDGELTGYWDAPVTTPALRW